MNFRTAVLITTSVLAIPLSAQTLTYQTTSAYERLYWNQNTHGSSAWGAWRPHVPSGYVRLGDVVEGSYNYPSAKAIVVKDSATLLAPPAGYTKLWSDQSFDLVRNTVAAGSQRLTIWRPVAKT